MTAFTNPNGDFSFTLFIRPSIIRACSLIFLSSTSDVNDTQARPYLGISSSGRLVAEFPITTMIETLGDVPMNKWSHVALTCSFSNYRISIYINGSLQISYPGPISACNPSITTPPVYLTLANPLGGSNGGTIQAVPFAGDIDEFNIWNRELSAAEIYASAAAVLTMT